MACSDPKCPIRKEGERQITCWLCDALFHVKCVGLLSRTTDQLMDGSLGLRWCCTKCRAVDVEFYRFFKGTQREVKEMRGEFENLLSRFSRFEELFSKFDLLDKLMETKVDQCPESTVVNRDMGIISGQSVQVVSADTAVGNFSGSNVSVGLPLPGAVDLIQLTPNPPLATVPRNVPSVSGDVPTADALLPSATTPKATAPPRVVATRDLIVVRPRKVIFVSRLAHDTAVDDIVHYVRSKVKVPFEFGCHKMKQALNRSIASFKLFVPDDKFDTIVDPIFWPQGIIVREFVFRESTRNKGVALSTVIPQKNRQ